MTLNGFLNEWILSHYLIGDHLYDETLKYVEPNLNLRFSK